PGAAWHPAAGHDRHRRRRPHAGSPALQLRPRLRPAADSAGRGAAPRPARRVDGSLRLRHLRRPGRVSRRPLRRKRASPQRPAATIFCTPVSLRPPVPVAVLRRWSSSLLPCMHILPPGPLRSCVLTLIDVQPVLTSVHCFSQLYTPVLAPPPRNL